MTTTPSRDVWLIDLDGVTWRGDTPIAGSREAIMALRASGRQVAFFTNNSFSTRPEMMAKFARHGIAVNDEELLSSAQSAAALVEPGSTATVLGGPGITEALARRGIEAIALDGLDGQRVDTVFVGLDRQLTFERLTIACRAVAGGATFVATNDDATYPTADGVWPGSGALVAAIAYATRVKPVVAGKPYPPAVALSRQLLGEVSVVVGDRPETDGELAKGLGARYGMVRSGVTSAGEVVTPRPALDAVDLAQLVAHELGMTNEQIMALGDLHS